MTTNYRIKLFQWAGIVCLAVPCLLTTGCRRLTAAEEKIVGTWEFTGIDASGRVVYRPDHTVVALFPEYDALNARWVPRSWGSWRLDGSEIVSETESLQIPGMPAIPKRVTRTPIREFHEERLVREEGRSDLIRIRSGTEIYSEVLALVYVIASLIALAATIYATRKSSFRKEFILLAAASVFALGWSTSTLVAELAQTGTVLVSASSLRSLRVPTEIARVICILIFIIGFVKLAFALGTRAPATETISNS